MARVKKAVGAEGIPSIQEMPAVAKNSSMNAVICVRDVHDE
jgi:hypothetical protein